MKFLPSRGGARSNYLLRIIYSAPIEPQLELLSEIGAVVTNCEHR
ncbi:hypothetical protein [Neobacillus ginsengisoli]|uniref:Uncharacterized protein n=1 Tax=Neobacillus ginsengisoli TaxID=904295 RepID=A0ABT9Y3R5_9BACI|nr:hypothetical protein [Neobacillus ginsengisoli]MDQ0202155.1 hypothetical protein [Neobacillus ginsengisoli]